MNEIEEIKSRLSIEEVVSKYVQLKKTGSSFKACCPFHKEKTPSFVVSPEKQLAYCFGCNKGGDLFKFVEEIENVDFKGALKILADMAGIEIKSQPSSHKDKSVIQEKDRLLEIIKEASAFFEENLANESLGKVARDYLQNRNILTSTIKDFHIGFALPSFEELMKYLLAKGFQMKELLKSGLVSESSFNSAPYDKFRSRIMFPILDHKGEIVGFTGRVLDEKDAPKYMNSPESVLYNKSEVLYGFYQAKDAIKENKKVVIVEGNADVVSCHQNGIKYVVASSGTALTVKQLAFLKRYTSNIYFSFDNDFAGNDATKRAVTIAQEFDLDPKIISFSEAKDPDELNNKFPGKYLEYIDKAKSYFDYFLDSVITSNISEKEAIKFLLEIALPVKSSVEKDIFIKKMSSRFNKKPEFLYDDLNRLNKFRFNLKKETKNIINVAEKFDAEDYFWGMIFEYPEQFLIIKDKLTADIFSSKYKNLLEIVSKCVETSNSFDKEAIFSSLDEYMVSRLKILMLFIESKVATLDEKLKNNEILKMIDRLFNIKYDRERSDLLNKMKKAKEEGNIETLNVLFKVYYDLLAKSPNRTM